MEELKNTSGKFQMYVECCDMHARISKNFSSFPCLDSQKC